PLRGILAASRRPPQGAHDHGRDEQLSQRHGRPPTSRSLRTARATPADAIHRLEQIPYGFTGQAPPHPDQPVVISTEKPHPSQEDAMGHVIGTQLDAEPWSP